MRRGQVVVRLAVIRLAGKRVTKSSMPVSRVEEIFSIAWVITIDAERRANKLLKAMDRAAQQISSHQHFIARL
jgi:hypothetical protein